MAVTEEQRHDLHSYFQETMGRERAVVMMELLPPVGWGDVATKRFVATEFTLCRAEFKAEMAELRGEFKAEMAELRGEVKAEMAELRGEVKAEMAELRGEFKAELHKSLNNQLLVIVGANVGYLGLTLAAAKLFF